MRVPILRSMITHKYPWRSSAVIIQKSKILLLHRVKNGREYFILPGGSMEDGESGEETLIRELKEEASITVSIVKKIGEVYNDFDKRTHRLFLCNISDGEVRLGGPEAERHNDNNKYILEWHLVTELDTIPFFPAVARQLIISNVT